MCLKSFLNLREKLMRTFFNTLSIFKNHIAAYLVHSHLVEFPLNQAVIEKIPNRLLFLNEFLLLRANSLY